MTATRRDSRYKPRKVDRTRHLRFAELGEDSCLFARSVVGMYARCRDKICVSGVCDNRPLWGMFH